MTQFATPVTKASRSADRNDRRQQTLCGGPVLEPLYARESGSVNWLVVSLVLSAVLTVVLNLALWVFPGLRDRLARSFERLAARAPGEAREDDRRVRVFVPWKVMIVGSLVLTIVVNLVLWLR